MRCLAERRRQGEKGGEVVGICHVTVSWRQNDICAFSAAVVGSWMPDKEDERLSRCLTVAQGGRETCC